MHVIFVKREKDNINCYLKAFTQIFMNHSSKNVMLSSFHISYALKAMF